MKPSKNYHEHHNPKLHMPSNSPKTNPTGAWHRSDQSSAPVRPVEAGQLGMNNDCGSTLPNNHPDVPIRSTDSHKTFGILGVPHGHPIDTI
jgi:hypothetical protein